MSTANGSWRSTKNTEKKVGAITNSHTVISKTSIAVAPSPHEAELARTNTSMLKMQRQTYLL
jgi:hypothetical protein